MGGGRARVRVWFELSMGQRSGGGRVGERAESESSICTIAGDRVAETRFDVRSPRSGYWSEDTGNTGGGRTSEARAGKRWKNGSGGETMTLVIGWSNTIATLPPVT